MMQFKATTSKARALHLREWDELRATFEMMQIDEIGVTIHLSSQDKKLSIVFPVNGVEADIVEQELGTCKSGTLIAMLRTDETNRSLLVRTIRT